MVRDRIFEELKNKGITQKAFSQMTGIAESTICDWKRKGLNPSVDKLPAICKALGISASELLGMEDTFHEEAYSDVLSADEKLIIETFRSADNSMQKRLLEYALHMSQENTVVDEDSSGSWGLYETDHEFLVKKQLAQKIRRLARLDRIALDESEHASGLNLHLFKYLDFVGLDKLTFIKEYLMNIQPFMLAEIKSQEKWDNAICVLDEYYRISIYIKIDARKGEELFVSFHENNKNGIAKRNSLIPREDWVYVFADSIGSHVNGTDEYTINIFITRGVKTFPISVAAHRYDDDLFRVRYAYISQSLLDYANNYLEDLYTADLDFSEIELFSALQQLSFTSYGNDVFSNISLLVDSLLIQRDVASKRLADGALCIYCNSLQLTSGAYNELMDTITARYAVNSVKGLDEVINRIGTYLTHQDMI